MSRKVRPLPPESLRVRNPEGYARAVDRHHERVIRQRRLDTARADAAYARTPRPAPARRRLVVPTVWRMPSLEDRGYFRTLTGGWRFFPSRSDLPGGAR